MNERVKLIRKQLGMTQGQLAQRLGIGKAALSMIETGKAGLSARNRNILVQELNVNPDWLETGKGNMFNAEPDLTAYMHRTDNSLPLQSVPLYSIEGTAGLVPLFTDQAQSKPVNFIHIPNLPKCDVLVRTVGDLFLLRHEQAVFEQVLRHRQPQPGVHAVHAAGKQDEVEKQGHIIHLWLPPSFQLLPPAAPARAAPLPSIRARTARRRLQAAPRR